MRVTVRVDTDGVTRALRGLRESVSRRALSRSLNRSVDAGRTEAVRTTTATLNLKAKTAREAIRVTKARTGTTEGAAIVIEPTPVPIHAFAAREVRKGVTVKIKRSGGRRLARGLFIAKMASGHVGVWRRLRGTKGPRSGREMLNEVFSSSPRQIFKSPANVARVTKAAAIAFVKAAQNEIRQARRGRPIQ